MPFRCISNPKTGFLRRAGLLLAAAGLALALTPPAVAFEILPDATPDPADPAASTAAAVEDGYDYYLAVSINGVSRDEIVAVHQEPDGSLSVAPADLDKIGILAPGAGARLPGARISLDHLPSVTYKFDAAQQSIDFTCPDAARKRLIVDADDRHAAAVTDGPPAAASRDWGALLNYDLYASANMADGEQIVPAPLSGSFEARAFGPFGLIEQTFSALSAPLEAHRLDTTWSYSDPQSTRTYRAGDIATGALSWTRPSRLGGVQIQNDFGLRSDIVTYPVPSISGSAALPSSVDIYIDNTNRFSSTIPAGPFDIVDVPVITGAGTVELVVRDPTGKQIVTKADYFASPQLLKPGLSDYSAELGFARTHFGTDADGYDPRLMGSASIRTGATDWLTWEGHAEGGIGLINGGSGLVAALGRLGTGQFSVAGSTTGAGNGLQVTGSVQLAFGSVTFGARAQRSFGRYEDIASFTAPDRSAQSAHNPATTYQLSLSLPTPFEGGRANLSYTRLDLDSAPSAQIVAASYGQRLFGGSASATAYTDLNSRNYGMSMSFHRSLGDDLSAGVSVHRDPQGLSLAADLGHYGGNQIGDIGWNVQANQGTTTDFSASARTKLPAATLRARVSHSGGQTGASGELSGAVVAADGGLFFSNPVEDAFAVVDVGAKDVPVLYRNNIVGVTGKNGKMLVPGLTAYEKNRISIDPVKLPLDRMVDDTTAIVSPPRGAGVTVKFGEQSTGGTALVSFRDTKGNYLPLASSGTASANGPEFVVGYDGQALLEDLGPDNIVTITLPDGSACTADVPFTAAKGGNLVNISDVLCQPV